MGAGSSTMPSSAGSSISQVQRVEFDSSYKNETVYVFPPMITSKVKVFKETATRTPQDPVLPRLDQDHAMVADQAKMESGHDRLKGEEAEFCVVTMLHQQLKKAVRRGDPPAFVFTGLQLQGCEKDVIIYHEKHGLIIVEIKAIEDIGTAAAPKGRSTLVKEAEQLEKARDWMTSELQGLLACPPKLVVAFPNLQGTDPRDIRQRIRFFQDNPEVFILCGRNEADLEAWLLQQSTVSNSLVWENEPTSHQAFVKAVSRHLSVEAYSPTETAGELAQVHRSWLLTPVQAPVLHCRDPLIHLWGPPGAGKTIMLQYKSRQWLQESKGVLIAVGDTFFSVLLQHLGRVAVNGQSGLSQQLRLCRDERKFEETLNELRRQFPDVAVVVDEVDSEFLSCALTAFRRDEISSLWTASVSDLSTSDSVEFENLGGRRILLPNSIRCPPSVVDVASKLQQTTNVTPPMKAFPALPTRLVKGSVIAIVHPSHPNYQSLNGRSSPFECTVCSDRLKSSMSPLVEGLPIEDENWKEWIIVYTGHIGVYHEITNSLIECLRGIGIPAVWELERVLDDSNLPIGAAQGHSSSQSSLVKDESVAWRERVMSGVDKNGRPAVHLVDFIEFRGLEKNCVLVLHWDSEDDNPDRQGQSQRDSRMEEHQNQLFHSVTRCQAELSVWLLSPSPAASCLP